MIIQPIPKLLRFPDLNLRFFSISFLGWILGLTFFFSGSATAQVKKEKAPGFTEIKWVSLSFALKNAPKNQRMIMIDFYTDWCGWCKVMDKKVYSQPAIIQYLNEKYYCIKFDAEGKDTAEYKGRVYTYEPDIRIHQFAYKMLNGELGYPTTVFLNPNGDPIVPVPGYLDPPTLETLLHYYGERKHEQNISYEDFQKAFIPTVSE
jgi:thioredoxin-related protein